MIKSSTKAANGVTELDAYPQLLGETNNRVVVVGYTDIDGKAWSVPSTASWVRINAVGRLISVIFSRTGETYASEKIDGTSFSKCSSEDKQTKPN